MPVRKTRHLSLERLTDYWLGGLAEPEMTLVEEHLAGCELCSEQSGRVGRLATLWDDWNARLEPPPAMSRAASFVEQVTAAARQGWQGAPQWPRGVIDHVHLRLGAAQVSIEGDLQKLGDPSLFPSLDAPTTASVSAQGLRYGRAVRHHVTGAARAQSYLHIEAVGELWRMVARLPNWPADKQRPLLLLVPSGADTAGGDHGIPYREAMRPEPSAVAEPQRLGWTEDEYGVMTAAEIPPGEYVLVFADPLLESREERLATDKSR